MMRLTMRLVPHEWSATQEAIMDMKPEPTILSSNMLMSNCTHSEIDKWIEFAEHEI
jgi:hypothetical protein